EEIQKKEKKLIKLSGDETVDYSNLNIKKLKKKKKNEETIQKKLIKAISEEKKKIKNLKKEMRRLKKKTKLKISKKPNLDECNKMEDKYYKKIKNTEKEILIGTSTNLEDLKKKVNELKSQTQLKYKELRLLREDYTKKYNQYLQQKTDYTESKDIPKKYKTKRDKEVIFQKNLQERKTLNEKVKNMKELVKKLKKHKYDPDCKFCIKNKFVKDATKAKKKLPKIEEELDLLNDRINLQEEELQDLNKIEEEYKNYVDLEKDYKNNMSYLQAIRENLCYFTKQYLETGKEHSKLQSQLIKLLGDVSLISNKKRIKILEEKLACIRDIKKKLLEVSEIKTNKLFKLKKELETSKKIFADVEDKLLSAKSIEDYTEFCQIL